MGKLSEILRSATAGEPEFLGVLRDVQPLVLLASFSIVIATFSAPISATAAGYAVTASMSFISAFVFLVLQRLVTLTVKDFDRKGIRTFTLGAYASIGLGLVLLFRVPGELAKAIPSVSFYGGVGNAVFYILLMLWLSDIMWGNLKRVRDKFPQSIRLRVLAGATFVGFIVFFLILAIEAVFPSASSILDVFYYSAITASLGGVLGGVYEEDRMKRLAVSTAPEGKP